MPNGADVTPEAKAAWSAFLMAITSGIEDAEEFIRSGWRRFVYGAEADAEEARDSMMRHLDDLDFDGQNLSSSYSTALAVQNRFDATARTWADRRRSQLDIRKVNRKEKDGGAAILVAGSLFAVSRGGPERVGSSVAEIANGFLGEATRQIDGPRTPKDGWVSNRNRIGSIRSWVENINMALEASVHMSRAPIIDATSGPMRRAALTEAIRKYKPVTNQMRLSFETHQRSIVRSALADYGVALDKPPMLLWLPAQARHRMSPEGFGAKQFAKIRTPVEWEGVRKSLDAKRPGSFIFSTGFHPGDLSYLIPVPPALMAAAIADARRRRQAQLEKVRDA